MILYHGSYIEVTEPDYWKGRARLDLIIGSVANDLVFDELEAYFNGYSDKSTAIEKLRYEEPNLQYCFANQKTIDEYLIFTGSEVLS
ncbi:MAG: DUF3990 domain-containing protein [Propionibacteriaceae bacterium]|jgi:hypothetical protein|nr:DUF3990 domain-containing protein [Propionibacteriaceae bacterium]